MLWFKHKNDLRRNPAVLRVEQKLPEVGYSRLLKLMEVVSQAGSTAAGFQPCLDLNGPAADEEWLAAELGIAAHEPVVELSKSLQIFAQVGLIDAESLKNRVVVVKMLGDLMDEFTQRKKNKSGVNPDSLGTESGAGTTPLPTQSGKEVEVEVDVDASEKEGEASRPEERPEPPLAFEGVHIRVTKKQDRLTGEAFPWADRASEYRKMDSWLEANLTKRPKSHQRFVHNWMSRLPAPSSRNGRQYAEAANGKFDGIGA